MNTSPRTSAAQITFDELIAALRRGWRPLAVWSAVGLCAAIAVGLVRPKSYTASASFVAEQEGSRSLPAGLTALAGQFGIGFGGSVERSPQFYSNLVETAGILMGILDSVIEVAPGESRSIRRLLHDDQDTSRTNLDRLLRKLNRRVSAQADARTGIVTVTVAATTPDAAEAVVALLISSIKHFNVATRQLQARELRVFLEGRVANAEQGLRQDEDALRTFYQRNRSIGDSPQLMFEEARMKRQIELRQELYTTLSRELETARIDEVNDTPTITIVDPPLASSQPHGPGLIVLGMIGFLLGGSARGALFIVTGR